MQSRSWRLGVWASSGIKRALGPFATNTPDVRSGVDIRAEFERTSVHGGGVDVLFPGSGLSIRVGWETTIGGRATGFSAVCDLVKCDPETGWIQTVPSTARGFVVEARGGHADGDRRVGPLFAIGLGRRWYSFDDVDCSGYTEDGRRVCDGISEIFREPESHTIVRASTGISAHFGGLRGELAGSISAGDYTGGVEYAQGVWHPDLRVTLSVGAGLF